MTPREALDALAREIDAWQDTHATLRGQDAALVRNAREIFGSIDETEGSVPRAPEAPGDALDAAGEAIRALMEHDGRRVAAWAAVARIEWLDPDVVNPDISPLSQRLDYATSIGLSADGALGLADSLAAKFRRIARQQFVDEE